MFPFQLSSISHYGQITFQILGLITKWFCCVCLLLEFFTQNSHFEEPRSDVGAAPYESEKSVWQKVLYCCMGCRSIYVTAFYSQIWSDFPIVNLEHQTATSYKCICMKHEKRHKKRLCPMKYHLFKLSVVTKLGILTLYSSFWEGKIVNWKATAVFYQKQNLVVKFVPKKISKISNFFIVYCNAIFYQRDRSSFSYMSREKSLVQKSSPPPYQALHVVAKNLVFMCVQISFWNL